MVNPKGLDFTLKLWHTRLLESLTAAYSLDGVMADGHSPVASCTSAYCRASVMILLQNVFLRADDDLSAQRRTCRTAGPTGIPWR